MKAKAKAKFIFILFVGIILITEVTAQLEKIGDGKIKIEESERCINLIYNEWGGYFLKSALKEFSINIVTTMGATPNRYLLSSCELTLVNNELNFTSVNKSFSAFIEKLGESDKPIFIKYQDLVREYLHGNLNIARTLTFENYSEGGKREFIDGEILCKNICKVGSILNSELKSNEIEVSNVQLIFLDEPRRVFIKAQNERGMIVANPHERKVKDFSEIEYYKRTDKGLENAVRGSFMLDECGQSFCTTDIPIGTPAIANGIRGIIKVFPWWKYKLSSIGNEEINLFGELRRGALLPSKEKDKAYAESMPLIERKGEKERKTFLALAPANTGIPIKLSIPGKTEINSFSKAMNAEEMRSFAQNLEKLAKGETNEIRWEKKSTEIYTKNTKIKFLPTISELKSAIT